MPFAIADATTLTEAGYVGEDVESVVKGLFRAAGGDVEKTARGIICIDEIDKIARKGGAPSPTRDVSGEGVQQALLKILEGKTATITPDGARNRPQQELIQIDTTDILFICTGAFNGLEDIVRRRVGQQGGLCRGQDGVGAPGGGRVAPQEILVLAEDRDLGQAHLAFGVEIGLHQHRAGAQRGRDRRQPGADPIARQRPPATSRWLWSAGVTHASLIFVQPLPQQNFNG